MIAQTELGENCEKLGIAPYLTYTTGWKIFVEMLQFGLILGSILVICSVSTIFAEESQTKMLPLIFSTEEGRRKDVMAKIGFLLNVGYPYILRICFNPPNWLTKAKQA